tara:strand:+ start:383 stop:1192 length:810 start_codon:yes stop_codon:yes gene_type:complete
MKILRVEAQKSMAKLGPDGIDAMLKRAHGQCVSNCVKQDAAYVGCLGKAATPDDIKGCTSAAAAKATPPKATPTPPQPQGQNPPDPRCNGACQHAVALLQPEMAKAAAGQDKPDMLPRMMEKARQMCVYQCSQAPEVAECLINSKTLEDVRTCKPNDRAAGNKTAPKGPLKVKTLKTTPIVTANPKGAVPVVSGDAKLCPDACANAMGIQVDQYRKKNGPQGKNLNETQLVNMLNAATKTCIEQCNANPSAVHCNLKAKSIGDLRKCVK